MTGRVGDSLSRKRVLCISMPEEMAMLVDKLWRDDGFSNRSEFFRYLVGMYIHRKAGEKK